VHATVLEPAARSARARIVAPELLDQFLAAMHDPHAAFDLRFRREPLTALAGALEKRSRAATAGADFTLTSGTVYWGQDQADAYIPIEILPDSELEPY
jgi:hypothetical protein